MRATSTSIGAGAGRVGTVLDYKCLNVGRRFQIHNSKTPSSGCRVRVDSDANVRIFHL
jgi:hypothetical protein